MDRISSKHVHAAPDPADQSAAAIESEILSLYDEHAPGMLRLALAATRDRDVALDSVQEAFASLLSEFRKGAPPLQPPGFLYAVLRDHLILAGSDSAPALSVRPATPDPDDLDAPIRQSELQRRLKLINSPREMELLRLRAEGLSYAEIAATLSLSPGTIASTLARAFRKIRREFRGEF